jgi:hypothetical protein
MTLTRYVTTFLLFSLQDIDWVQTEKHVFETASNHPFLVGLHSCFQTASRCLFLNGFSFLREIKAQWCIFWRA